MLRFAFSAVCLFAGSWSPALAETGPDPREVVTAFTKLAVADNAKAAPTSPFFEDAERRPLFSKGFEALVKRAEAAATKDGSSLLDFDPVSNSQDAELKGLTVGEARIDGDKAVVAVRFSNHGQGTSVTYDLVRENGAWKIDDLEGRIEKEAWSVRAMLKDAK